MNRVDIVTCDRIIGWDIGGAHVKAALIDSHGRMKNIVQLACPLWKGMAHLQSALDQASEMLGPVEGLHAVTMTGEMADNFNSRNNGVYSIINEMVNKFGAAQVMIFAGSAGYLNPRQAAQAAMQVASANWLATATWLSKNMPRGLLVDIGSTTTDLIPFARGSVLARGHTDRDRLRHEELVYTGIARTPIMSLARQVPVEGEWIGLMAEHFATTADIYRVLQTLPENADLYPAADAGDKTLKESERRLARMVGMDIEESNDKAWHDVARYLEECQLRVLMDACARVLSRDDPGDDAPLIGAGVGRFLAVRLAARFDRQYMDFNSFFETRSTSNGLAAADCAPAVAVAALLQRKLTATTRVSGLYS